MRQPDFAQSRVERREQQIFGEDARLGEAVEQRRFAGVGVADQRDHRIRHVAPRLAVQAARALDLIEFGLDAAHPLLDQAAVGFDLRFAGAAEEAEAAALAFKMGPTAHQPRFLIFEMRQLNLHTKGANSR